MFSNELKILHLENRISKLGAKPVQNQKLINKLIRQVKNLKAITA